MKQITKRALVLFFGFTLFLSGGAQTVEAQETTPRALGSQEIAVLQGSLDILAKILANLELQIRNGQIANTAELALTLDALQKSLVAMNATIASLEPQTNAVARTEPTPAPSLSAPPATLPSPLARETDMSPAPGDESTVVSLGPQGDITFDSDVAAVRETVSSQKLPWTIGIVVIAIVIAAILFPRFRRKTVPVASPPFRGENQSVV